MYVWYLLITVSTPHTGDSDSDVGGSWEFAVAAINYDIRPSRKSKPFRINAPTVTKARRRHHHQRQHQKQKTRCHWSRHLRHRLPNYCESVTFADQKVIDSPPLCYRLNQEIIIIDADEEEEEEEIMNILSPSPSKRRLLIDVVGQHHHLIPHGHRRRRRQPQHHNVALWDGSLLRSLWNYLKGKGSMRVFR